MTGAFPSPLEHPLPPVSTVETRAVSEPCYPLWDPNGPRRAEVVEVII